MTSRDTLRRSLRLLLSAAVVATGLVAVDVAPATASYRVPPTPSGLTAAIEDAQPYIGQSTCQPTAKSGVVAFKNLLLRTYPDTGSLGITKDCGSPEQSEHKEGRAFDWAVSAYNSRQKAEATTLLSWLTATDQYGNKAAMARRLGVMYIIWDHRMWRAYNMQWLPYSGSNPHTDHVHFSFGWNGAKGVTSYWTHRVAPIDFGPTPPPHITPVRRASNIALVRQYGGTTLTLGTTGTAVRMVQSALRYPVDGSYWYDTAAYVARFQQDQHLKVTQVFGRSEWKALFPPPVIPFGGMDATRSALGNLLVSGWALDADTTGPIQVSATLDGSPAGTATASGYRGDVAKAYPEYGGYHGFSLVIPAVDGPHTLCVTAVNAPGTPGSNGSLGCRTVALNHNPVGALESLRPTLGVVRVTGWALDPDATDPVTTSLTVDGAASPVVPTSTTRTDVGAAWPGMGDNHGITADLVLSEGTHTVCLSAANLPGTPGSDAALGCRTVVVPHSPTGALEFVRRVPGGVQVHGWAVDPDVVDPVTVDVLSDGALVTTVTADLTRTDVAARWPDQGAAHGFDAVVTVPDGTHDVSVRLHNAASTQGHDVTLPARSVTVAHDPVGLVTALRNAPGTGAVLLNGAAVDPDTAAAVTVVPVVDGVKASPLTANLASNLADARWPGYGRDHAFAATLTLAPGPHTVCLSMVNVPATPGVDRSLACRRLAVSNALGQVRTAAVYPRTVVVRGWALDPDVATASPLAVVVDGRLASLAPASRWSSTAAGSFPGYGAYHGFSVAVSVTKGTHTVCVTARNVSGTPGTGTLLGCSTVSFA